MVRRTIHTTLKALIVALSLLALVSLPVWADVPGEIISPTLETEIHSLGEPSPQSVAITWAASLSGPFDTGVQSFTLKPGDNIELWLDAARGGEPAGNFTIPGALFILEGATNQHFDIEISYNATDTPLTTAPLSWSPDYNAFYFGDTPDVDQYEGFTMTSAFYHVYRLRLTARVPGDFNIKLYAVQLPAGEEE